VPHARVRAVRLAPPQLSLDVESDDAGRFALSLPEGSVLLAAEAEGYAPTRANFVAPSRGVELVLTPGGGVSGTVIAESDGKPLPGIEVRAVPSSNRNAPVFASALSDEQGAFRIEGLEPGSYALSARGGPWYGELAQSIDLGLGDHAGNVAITASAAAEVSGRVWLDDGRACEQGYVALRTAAPALASPEQSGERSARSAFLGLEQIAEIQPDGAVHFPGVLPAFYAVTVRCLGRLLRDGPRELQVASDSLAGLKWTVAAGTALSVRVVDGRKQAVAFAPFVLRYPEEAGRRPITVYRSDARGGFEIPGLAPGAYQISPQRPAQGATASVELRAEQAHVEVTLELAGSAAIEVVVESSEGTPRDDVRVSASVEGGVGIE